MDETIKHLLDIEKESSEAIDNARDEWRKRVDAFRIEEEARIETERKRTRDENAAKKKAAVDEAREKASREMAGTETIKDRLEGDGDLCLKIEEVIVDLLLKS